MRCGYDQSAYVYERRDKRWALLLASEQNDYDDKTYHPQRVLQVSVSPEIQRLDHPRPPPLVLTLGYSPWCSSNWTMLYTRLWRAAPADVTPPPVLDRADELYRGDAPAIAAGSVTPGDVLVEYRTASIDGDVLIRPAVRHYLVGPGDKLERIAPVALGPKDFVDEWLTSKWRVAAAWSSSESPTLARWHRVLHGEHLLGEFDPPRRCRVDPTIWQVGFAPNDQPKRFYRVRWMPPYRFTMVAVAASKRPGCDQAVPMPDDLGTLFPL